MKKVLALLVAVFVLAAAGSALAAGHDVPVTPTPTAEDVQTEYVPTGTVPVQVTIIPIAFANVPSFSQIIQAIASAVQTAINNNATIQAMGTLRNSDNLVPLTDNVAAAQKLAIAQAKLGAGRKAIGALPPFSVVAAGAQPVTLPKFDAKFYGMTPRIDLFPRSRSTVRTAAEGDAVFLNSAGNVVTTIPSGDVAGVEAGVVTAVVQMEAGETYDPAISVSEAEANTVFTASDYQTVTAEVPTYKEVKTTAHFSTNVPADIITKFNSTFSGTYKEISADCVGTSFDFTGISGSANLYWEYAKLNQMPYLTLPDGNYIAAISFDLSEIAGETLYTEALGTGFMYFFPLGGTGNANFADYTLVDANMTEVYEAGDIVATKPYYIAFTVSNGAITADTRFSPVILTKISLGEEETYGGGSSGGCSAGFGALTLAVLGGLFALRRKQ